MVLVAVCPLSSPSNWIHEVTDPGLIKVKDIFKGDYLMKKILVLGAGQVGALIAEDLSTDFDVTILDSSYKALQKEGLQNCTKINKSFSDCGVLDTCDIAEILKPFDIVVGALPGKAGFNTAKKVITAGKDYVDISFAPEDLRELNDLAKEKDVRCLFDFGLAPGLSHLMFGHFNKNYYRTDPPSDIKKYHIYVGGLVKFPEPPYYYKCTFSPHDVYAEYTRPARFLYKGKVVTKPALSDREIIQFDNSYYEAFLTDGVRTLLTAEGPDEIIEKTIRTPGHLAALQSILKNDSNSTFASHHEWLRDWFSNNVMGPTDEDETLMKIKIEFEFPYNNEKVWFDANKTIHIYDEHDGKHTSMSRTTGYTCASGVRLLAQNLWTEKGVFAPEEIGENRDCYFFVMRQLEDKGIEIRE